MAGVMVDTALFPLETIKTRLQSAQGFQKAGGFRSIYKGLVPVIVGGAPSAGTFFWAYETVKIHVLPLVDPKYTILVYVCAASLAELPSCLVKVPVDIVKQRRQTSQTKGQNMVLLLYNSYKAEGLRRGLFRGYSSTVLRDIPFSVIQLPLWELLKDYYSKYLNQGVPLSSFNVAMCGAVAGGVAAAATTPLDVIKTRIILATASSTDHELRMTTMAKKVYREKGLKGLFAGITPRVVWITAGGAVFFGTYDLALKLCDQYHCITS